MFAILQFMDILTVHFFYIASSNISSIYWLLFVSFNEKNAMIVFHHQFFNNEQSPLTTESVKQSAIFKF